MQPWSSMTSIPAASLNDLSHATNPEGNKPSPTYFSNNSMTFKQVVSVHLVRCCNLRRSFKNSSGLIAQYKSSSAVVLGLAGGTLHGLLVQGTFGLVCVYIYIYICMTCCVSLYMCVCNLPWDCVLVTLSSRATTSQPLT